MLVQAESWSFAVTEQRRAQLGFSCSLFVAGDRDQPIYGRNFDNQPGDFLVGRYQTPGNFASIAFTRLTDLGLDPHPELAQLSAADRVRFLAAAFFVADGINQHGVTVALAAHEPQPVLLDPSRPSIHVSALCRLILDRTASVDQALHLARGFNVYDMREGDSYLLEHHVLVADPSGASAVLEAIGGTVEAVHPADGTAFRGRRRQGTDIGDGW